MNVLLIVVDSLRASSLVAREHGEAPRTPFLTAQSGDTICFRRAYATECWTLPTHCSIFTGQLPSQHGAHFQTMAFGQPGPTLAEILSRAGFHTEIVTRNFIFDATIPGLTRGFRTNTRIVADAPRISPFALFLALAKPRFRRHLRETGFFHPLQQSSPTFLKTFARALMPADDKALAYALQRMAQLHRENRPFFVFCNLYDVHAPYPPRTDSILREFGTASGCLENVMFPSVMAKLGAHRYLRSNFRLSERSRKMLLSRYHRAIELMDVKLAEFWNGTRQARLLEDTLVILTSDHGEAFGDHHLYLHDASVYQTHLHVPLWIYHPNRAPEVVDDVVSTRDLFGLIRGVALGTGLQDTLLDSAYRARHPIALAEHFYYTHRPDMHPRYRQNLTAAISRRGKIIVRRDGVELYDLDTDPDERSPERASLGSFEDLCRREGYPPAAVAAALQHCRQWQAQQG